MRLRFALLGALGALLVSAGSSTAALARATHPQPAATHPQPAATQPQPAATQRQPAATLCRAGYYRNVDGRCVERPDAHAAGATARCRDGSYSHSRHASGTCSHHGGVAVWIHHP